MTHPTIVIDTREQRPWTFADHPTVHRALPAGDYSVDGLEHRVAIERKSIADLVSTLTAGRERFERELQKLADYERAIIIVEGDLEDVIAGRYRSKVPPQCLVGSFGSFFAQWGIATVFAGSVRNAQILARSFLVKAAKYIALPTTDPAALP
ncbi:MAG: hypothetical protein HOW73_32945 [Polyangiaceae bacterium]|nr:hypothetical protein [Polyangiaceae bacterium]